MYLRFVVSEIDETSGRRQGLFQLAAELRETGVLHPLEEDALKKIQVWFNEHLEKPAAFARSRKPNAASLGLSWFKDTAKGHIAKMYEFARILESHGVHVQVIKSERPGYVVYEDKFQVTAEPYAETGA